MWREPLFSNIHLPFGEHQEAGRAVTTLNAGLLNKALLDGMQLLTLGQPFHGHDLSVVGPGRSDHAGHHGSSIHEDGAGPTLAFGTTFLGAREICILTQGAQQGFMIGSR